MTGNRRSHTETASSIGAPALASPEATATIHAATHSLLDPKPQSDGCRLYRHTTLNFDT